MQHSDTTISILCYTALDKCKRLMDFLMKENSGANFILTANGNPHVSRYFDWLRANHPDKKIDVIHNQINQGFIAPNNLAFSLTSTPFFILLNDDALPPDNWISMLKAPFSCDEKMAIVGASGACNTLDENFVGHKGNQLDYCEASCMAVLRKHMPNPLFDKSLRFSYGEDAFLSLVVRERGLKIAQADFKLVEHFRNTTSRTIPGIRHIMADNFATCRKRWGFYLKHRKFENQCASQS